MIKRYFYIFSASLFILFTSTTGVRANMEDYNLEALARQTNSPPDGFNYQAVLRDNNGDVLTSSSITMRFTLSDADGDVWIETHLAITDANGMVTLIIGSGTQEGGSATSFSVIDWSAYISVKVEGDSGAGFVDLGTSTLQSVPYANYAKNGLTSEQAIEIEANTLKTGITTAQAAEIVANTAKGGITEEQAAVINNISGTNTGDQDISGIGTNAAGISTNADAIALNTAKTGITSDQTDAITANSAKVGVSSAQATILDNTSGTNTGDQDISGIGTNASAIALNTAKTGITSEQADEITANTVKVGVTTAESTLLGNTSGANTGDQDISGIDTNASAIALNTAKTGITSEQAVEITANTVKVGVTTAQSTLLGNTSGANTGDQDISGIDTNATAIALNTAKTGVSSAQAAEITANTVKVGVTTAQANLLGNTSGANTGDQDISGIDTNTSDISTNASAIALNTAKTGITSAQADEITANTVKVGVTTAQSTLLGNTSGANTGDQDISGIDTNATAIALNTAKTGISTAQAAEITANTAKVGVTTAQATLLDNTSGTNTGDQDISGIATNATTIALNTDKTGITTAQAAEITANTAKVGVTTAQSTLLGNTSGTNTGDQDISGISTNTSSIATNATAIALNTDKTGISTAQAAEITANTAKTSGSFSTAANLISAGDADDDFVFGSTQLADQGSISEDSRMFFDKSKGAFRAGVVMGTEWDDANVGNQSVVSGGFGNTASSQQTTVGGGYNNTSSGIWATIAGGRLNTASGNNSFVGGGNNNVSSGNVSLIAGGYENVSSRQGSVVSGGVRNNATANYSAIGGGRYLDAQSLSEFAVGQFSLSASAPSNSTFVATDRIFTIGNGTADAARSNAMTILKNGNTDINGALVANSLGVDGVFTLPTADGTAGQVLSTDGSGVVTWATASGGGGANYAGSGGDSFVAGYNNFAAGNYSTVSGGLDNSASGEYSTIGGGYTNVADAYYSTVSGGFSNSANKIGTTVAGGKGNSASGDYSSVAGGLYVRAQARGEFAVGLYSANAASASGTTSVPTDRLLTVGNGTSDAARSNAMTILKNGNTDINGALVANSLGVDGQFTLPSADGTAGQVLSTNGSGTVAWATSGGNYAGGGTDSFVAGKSNNTAAGLYATVSGGSYNTASGVGSTIGGGSNNSSSANRSTIGGGSLNISSNSHSVVSGGARNTASGAHSQVGGGRNNIASGNYSTVGGGRYVNAQSMGEFAVGLYSYDAASSNPGSFVSTNRIFTVGNGTDIYSQSNAFTILKNGNATLAGTLTQNSDRRLKRDIAPLGSTLDKVNEMEGVTYKWNDLTPRDTTEANIGLIAQEVEKLFPALVKDGDNGYKSVNYIQLVPVLIEAIKELSKENEALEVANANMEIKQQGDDEKFDKLEAKLNLLMQLVSPELTAQKD